MIPDFSQVNNHGNVIKATPLVLSPFIATYQRNTTILEATARVRTVDKALEASLRMPTDAKSFAKFCACSIDPPVNTHCYAKSDDPACYPTHRRQCKA